MDKEIIIAMQGLSKLGKTSFINSLGHDPEKLLPLQALNNARTKITVNYRFVPYKKEAEDQRICMTITREQLIYNNLNKEKEIANFLGIEKEENGKNPDFLAELVTMCKICR